MFSPAAMGGFSLPELVVGVAVASLVLAALALSFTSLERSLTGTDDYAAAQDSQLRVMDYLTRDLRRASSATVSGDGSQVSMTVPDYYDTYDNSGEPTLASNPRDPTVTFAGSTASVTFGTSPRIITYFVDPATKSLIRQVDWTSGGAPRQFRRTIADAVQNFALNFTSVASVVQAQITFLPTFQRGPSNTGREGTTLRAAVTLRNVPL